MPASTPAHTTGPDVHPSTPTLLHRDLGVWGVVFMVVAAAAPLGALAALMPVMVSTSGSVGTPLFFVIAAVILILFTFGFTAMSKHIPNAGAFYSYIQAGLGRHVGTGAAALAVGAYLVLLIAANTYLGVAGANVVETLTGVSPPWWLIAFIGLAIVGFLGYRDIDVSAKVLGVALIAETLVIVVLAVAILLQGAPGGGFSLEPMSPSQLTVGAPSIGVMFAIFGFIGFEATAVFRSEARDPDRTIPRATYIAVVFIGCFYALAAWVLIVGVGTSNAVAVATDDPQNFTVNLGEEYLHATVKDLIQVLVVTSTFAVVLAFHNVTARYQFTLARKGLLPARLGAVDTRQKAPSNSSFVVSGLSVLVTALVLALGLDPIAETYTWLSGAASLGLIALLALTSLAVINFFRTAAHPPGAWTAVIAPGLAFLGLATVLVLVIKNFSLLVGGATNAVVIGGALVAAFVVGMAGAEYLRRNSPDHYQALSSDK